MKKKVLIGIFLMAIAGLIAVLATGVFDENETATSNGLRTVPVTRRDISSTVIATGIIKPGVGAEVRVGSRISGVVKRLYTNIGDKVKKGRLLAELDPTENNARFNQASAALELAQANLDYASLDLKRQQQLLKKQFVSQDRVDTAERSFDVARSQFKQAKANMDYAKIQLDYTKIFAPITGVVASISTQEGETVSASLASPTFVTIIDLERLEVQAYVDETDIGRVSEGQRAVFTVDTFPDTDFEGSITAIYPKADIQNNVVNYITIINMTDNKGKILRPEMTTTVTIFLTTRNNVLVIPTKAIRREGGRKFVYVRQGPARKPLRKSVTTGWKYKSYTEITKGLEENQLVIIGDITL
ncbi:MAG: efflux RND transporter periplasmic adaptor subunit [bacterium]|nr:efflux RND transporter periplasmic adaptor subunit [bacterium]